MERTPEQQAAWEQQCYGCSQVEAKHGIDELVKFNNAGRPGPANMSLGSILSDVQALIEAADEDLEDYLPADLDRRVQSRHEQARQYLNRVKFAIFEAAPIHLWQREGVAP